MDLGRFFEYGYGNKDYRGSFLRRGGGEGEAFLSHSDSLTILTLWSEYKGSKVGIDERD